VPTKLALAVTSSPDTTFVKLTAPGLTGEPYVLLEDAIAVPARVNWLTE
jgi:hypothetical protein